LKETMLDVHVRMRVEELTGAAPQHLFSQIDPMVPSPGGAVAAALKGSTEWAVDGPRRLTFGWDWTYEPASSRFSGRWSTLRTNLMVVDEHGTDMGVDCLRLCVARLMTQARWEATIAVALQLHPYH